MLLSEPAVQYRVSNGIRDLVQNSNHPYPSKDALNISGISDLLEDKLLLSLVIQEGLPFDLFQIIQGHTPFSEIEWAGFLGISTKSIQRYKKDNNSFKPIQTEKILEVTEVCHLGLEIFGDLDKFSLWLNTPNFALGKISPINLMKDSYGKDLVITELIRVDHGVFV